MFTRCQKGKGGLGTAEKYKSKVLWFYRCVCILKERTVAVRSPPVWSLLWWAANLNIKVPITHIQREKQRERDLQLRVFSSFPEALRGDEVFKLQVLWHSGYFVLITLALPLCYCFGIYFNFNLYSSRSLHSDFQHPVISLLKCQDLSAQKRDYG